MHRLAPLFISILFFSCAQDSDTFTVKATAKGFDSNTAVYVYEIENKQPVLTDTLYIENESFSITYPKSDALTINYFKVDGTRNNIFFFPENEDLKATIYKDSLPASFVNGSKQNDDYYTFAKQIRLFSKQISTTNQEFITAKNEQDNILATELRAKLNTLLAQEKEFKKDFVFTNNNSLISVMLTSEMIRRKEISPADAKKIADNFTPRLNTAQATKDLKKLIAANKQKAAIGQVAPNFSAKTPEGTTLSLNETLGKYTIIDFWASWCKPCRKENPNVVRVYNKYHDKGLNIISVSLDRAGQEDRWIKAIKDDNMDWYHISNLRFWDDPIARQYNVRSIPATFLLDENGVIIGKNLRGNALETKIASLLGGQ